MSEIPVDMQALRADIDALDERLVALLGERQKLVQAVARIKRAQTIPMRQPGRRAAVKAHVAELAAQRGLEPSYAQQLYDAIIVESCRLEDLIIDGVAGDPNR